MTFVRRIDPDLLVPPAMGLLVIVVLGSILLSCGGPNTDPTEQPSVPQMEIVARDGSPWSGGTEVFHFSDRGNECYVATRGDRIDLVCVFGEG